MAIPHQTYRLNLPFTKDKGDDYTMTMCSLVWGRDYFVRYIPMGMHIGGVSTSNHDGTYNIYINANLYATQQLDAFLHELAHCALGHFDERSYLTEAEMEAEAELYKGRVPVIIPVDIGAA